MSHIGVSSTQIKQSPWNHRSLTYWLTASISLGLIILGINGFIQPEPAIRAYGLSNPHDFDFDVVRVKAGRDLITGVLVAALVIFRMKRSSIIACLIMGIGIPTIDTIIVLNQRDSNIIDAWPHLVAIAYILIICFLFFRERRIEKNEE
ncbi:DUF4267 domain-containing protein [Staphylococcus ureilyticus]|uniref:DUF4267 domain-containing protein n=1 Tax=Staphylococcus ureilyticus TaxID=94138 RepID=UPI0030BDAC85